MAVEGAELEALGEPEESVLADSSVFLLQLESVRTAHIANTAIPKREKIIEFIIPHYLNQSVILPGMPEDQALKV